MCSSDLGRVAVTADAWRRLRGKVRGESIGIRALKGKGDVELYEVTAPNAE